METQDKITPQNFDHWFNNYFKPHFDELIIKRINNLISEDALVGFIFMSCSIDYLAGFWYGKNTKNHVKDAYTDFIKNYFTKGVYDENSLYDCLKNGLVHLFSIKNRKYCLTDKHHELHLKLDGSGQILLNAENFRDDLLKAVEKYFDDLLKSSDLQKKFLERYYRDEFLGIVPFTIYSNKKE